MTHAAHDLYMTDERILDISLKYHFESQESFSRAFKKLYGVNPGNFRKYKKEYHTLYMITERKRLDRKKILHFYEGGVTMEPKIITKEAFKAVGLKSRSPQPGEIPALWNEFRNRLSELNNIKNPHIFYGLIERQGEKVRSFNYYPSQEIMNGEDVPEGFECIHVMENQYVVFTHKGSLDKLSDTYHYIYGNWFPKSGYDFAEGCEFELMDSTRFFGPMDENSEIDIYIPIK